MNKCLKILVQGTFTEKFLIDVIQRSAKRCNIEGTGRLAADGIHIMVCGSKDKVDMFVHVLYTEVDEADVTLEPFIKERDFRGVFRIIQ
jgi:acylphosphatase